MIFVCEWSVVPECKKVWSHGRDSKRKAAMCRACAKAIRLNPSLGEKSLETIMEGSDAREAKRRTA